MKELGWQIYRDHRRLNCAASGASAGGLGQAAGGAADDGAGLGGGLVPHQQPLAEHGGLPVLAVHVERRRCPEDVEPVHENEGSGDGCSQQLNKERTTS